MCDLFYFRIFPDAEGSQVGSMNRALVRTGMCKHTK